MNCPYCNFEFKAFYANASAKDIPDMAPLVCEGCARVSLLIDRKELVQVTDSQLNALRKSPAWRDVIEPARKVILEQLAEKEKKRLENIPPADRSAQTLTDGRPVTADHREINPETGMQKGYVVLSAEERAKGFVRPVRRSYLHKTCNTTTTMGQTLAETYARDPGFYSGTFCCACRSHFPLSEFVWTGTTEQVGS